MPEHCAPPAPPAPLARGSHAALEVGRELRKRSVDWEGVRYDDARRNGLIELMLRITQSMVVDPPDPPRTGVVVRSFLRQWIAPAVAPRHEPHDPQWREADDHVSAR